MTPLGSPPFRREIIRSCPPIVPEEEKRTDHTGFVPLLVDRIPQYGVFGKGAVPGAGALVDKEYDTSVRSFHKIPYRQDNLGIVGLWKSGGRDVIAKMGVWEAGCGSYEPESIVRTSCPF